MMRPIWLDDLVDRTIHNTCEQDLTPVWLEVFVRCAVPSTVVYALAVCRVL